MKVLALVFMFVAIVSAIRIYREYRQECYEIQLEKDEMNDLRDQLEKLRTAGRWRTAPGIDPEVDAFNQRVEELRRKWFYRENAYTYSHTPHKKTCRPRTAWHIVLGVEKEATLITIKKAYREKARQYHPDSSSDGIGNPELFITVTEAYLEGRRYVEVRSRLHQCRSESFWQKSPSNLVPSDNFLP